MRRLHAFLPCAVAAVLVVAVAAGAAARPSSALPSRLATTPRGLGLLETPYLGVACSRPNLTTCGRVGIAVWLRGGASVVAATFEGARVRLLRPGTRRDYWGGFVRLRLRRLGLPAHWFGDPAKRLRLRLAVRYGRVWRTRRILVALHAGWG